MDTHPKVGFTHGACVDYFADQPFPQLPADADDNSWLISSGQQLIETFCTLAADTVSTPMVIVRTELQKKVGGYRRDLPHSGDMEMWLRLAAHAAVGEFKACQAIKRTHQANMSIAFFTNMVRDYKQKKAAFDVFFSGWGDRVADGDRLLRRAHRGLAEDVFWTAIAQFLRGNKENCRQLMNFAFAIQPDLRFSPPLSRLLRKQRLDLKTWSVLRSIVGRILGGGGMQPRGTG